jgi:hypothetical protein
MKCWLCGNAKMDPMDGKTHWLQCHECGATACEKPTTSSSPSFSYGEGIIPRSKRAKPWGVKEE